MAGLLSCLSLQDPTLSQCGRGSVSATCMDVRSWVRRRWPCPPGLVLLVFTSLLSCLLTSCQAKVFGRCALASVLQDYGLEGYRGYSLADSAVDHEADGSTNNGLFQINSRKWCKNLNAQTPNLCQMYCTDLLNPNLKDTVICAMKIAQEPLGLGTWEAWRHHCQGKDLTDWVDGCDI
ncbi:sperm acrosome membrane-associated protein 3 isoform X2 [Erinaceus europaeus]|uniref:Sperm acrosome membrane-associated protein 3 isoform X2 n=1 Tax=Erinaceus europaeus TaxID=9365 RepID=A0ABM3YBH7_ERIEU|nr:sperm acrosome membrane-associated protein 3 isoform X2 [Erinaceus europaeus]